MLYTESRQSGKKDSGALTFNALLFFLLLLTGCQESSTYSKHELTIDAFSSLKVGDYVLDSHQIKKNLERLCSNNHEDSWAVRRTAAYYNTGGSLLWVGYNGVDERADTLVEYLRQNLPRIGFSQSTFHVDEIAADIERLRTLSFDDANPLNLVAARLDFNLTSAYLRYVVGQRFGFVNPHFVLNRLDARDRDTAGVVLTYRQLFDVAMQHPDDSYVQRALRRITFDSLGIYLRQVEPVSPLYSKLKALLPQSAGGNRLRVLVNMERCRWREHQNSEPGQKYVVVNVPAYHLWAVGPDSIVDMRVACGALKTKTPLLSSRITHMEVNPEWVIPMTIVRDEVSRHAGDSAYFARHSYYIADRKTGNRLPVRRVSRAMLCSGNYRVAQQGGAGNALGRIIFRFPNNFSVFLHDTSSPGAFGRDNRGVSHGCVRVQRPFDLAVFLMDDSSDEWLLDRLRISMGMKPETDRGRDFLDNLDPAAPTPTLVHNIPVTPRVPIFITYYTIFLSPDGTLQYYPDVYGYDDTIGAVLNTYIQ